MRIVTVRRISQVFFLMLFLWLCVVSTFGTHWWQLRGWPVNWFLELDPLVAIGTMLSTHTLYRGLIWALLTVVLTVIFGRFFCGWVCPFGTMHHFFGYLAQRGKKLRERFDANRYRKAQVIKYYVLLVFLVMAAVPLGTSVSLQTGLLDPIPLVYRSVNLVLLPLADPSGEVLSAIPRQYGGAFLIGLVFLVALLLNFVIPRFYCRIICPLGALLGLLGRFAPWRIGRTGTACTGCDLCITACEGACEPAGQIRISDCLLCFNCTNGRCKRDLLTYSTSGSVVGEHPAPDMGRRQVLVTLSSAVLAVPMMRVAGTLGSNWHHQLVRPPGSLPEPGFLERCIKCGQCMRICPTNVIVPAGFATGLESVWTPVLDFRNGTSGCQLNCTACGHWCPTAAIRPLSLEERLGVKQYAEDGPIRMGTAFVDRGRCLPWAMDTPCIVCEENCPVTPKAIFVKELYNPVRFGAFDVTGSEGDLIEVSGPKMSAGQYATGDYYAVLTGDTKRHRIAENTENSFAVAGHLDLKEGSRLQVFVRLQVPCVDITKCVGCGICEHECPVSGLRAIRVTAENETRNVKNSLMLERSQG